MRSAALTLAAPAATQPRFADVSATHLPPPSSVSQSSMDVEAADLDGDGYLDLVRVHFGLVQVLLNDGTGRFADATHKVLPGLLNGPGVGVEIADLDGDGRPDLYGALLAGPGNDPGGFDRLLLQAAPTGTEETGTLRPGLRLDLPYPNPSDGTVTVPFSLPTARPVRLGLVGADGREAGVFAAGRHEVALDLGALPSGAYPVVLTEGEERADRPLSHRR